MPVKGAGTSTGVLIVTSALNTQVTYIRDGVVRFGTGLEWGTIYQALLEHESTAVGARDYTVGVGGFVLGGGLSHLSNQYGFSADNIINAEVCVSNQLVWSSSVHRLQTTISLLISKLG